MSACHPFNIGPHTNTLPMATSQDYFPLSFNWALYVIGIICTDTREDILKRLYTERQTKHCMQPTWDSREEKFALYLLTLLDWTVEI